MARIPTPDISAFEDTYFTERRSVVQTPHCPEPPLKSQSVSRLFSQRRALYTPSAQHVFTPASAPASFNNGADVCMTPVPDDRKTQSYFEEHFENLGLLGQGSFGDVFRVRERGGDGRMYAVKRSRRAFRGVKDRKRSMQEVAVAAALSGGRHCVRMFDAWEENGHLFIQTEVCDEGTLRDYIDAHAARCEEISDDVIWEFLIDIALGLKDIHDQRVIHLDIKPENLFLSDGSLKIGDFGIAYKAGSHHPVDLEGDPIYLPAELLESVPASFEADIFSLGATIFELLSNIEMPAGGPLWHELRRGRVPVPPHRDAALGALVQRMMAHDPRRRPAIDDVLLHPEVARRLEKRSEALLFSRPPQTPGPLLFTTNKNETRRVSLSEDDVSSSEDMQEEDDFASPLGSGAYDNVTPKNLINMFEDT